MRVVLFMIASLMFTATFAQDSTSKYFLKEVGWSIQLPPGFVTLDTADEMARRKRGEKVLEKTLHQDVDGSSTRTLISAKKGFNYFNATLTPFNKQTDGSYRQTNQGLKDIMYETMVQQTPNGKIDSFSTKTTVDGLKFDKFTIRVKLARGTIFDMVMLTRLYKGYDFGITYVAIDPETRRQIEDMLAGSTFVK